MRRREFIAGGENRRGWDWAGGGSGGFWRRPDMRGRTGRRSLHPPLGRIGASLAPPCVVAARLESRRVGMPFALRHAMDIGWKRWHQRREGFNPARTVNLWLRNTGFE
jgi:hypothetical protein